MLFRSPDNKRIQERSILLIGIPLTPVRLKCAILGLGVLKLALHKARGTPLPEEWGTSSRDLVLE